jgi:DNA replication and repair protein RecF
MRSRIQRLSLANFRSYAEASLETEGRTCFLFGPNGAGKTNLLEAISLFSPGRGLRGAAASEVGRQHAGEVEGRPWAVAAEVISGDDLIALGTGVETAGATRRVARLAGENVPVSSLAEHVRPLWLTPAHDRLFAGAAGDRRRFLDRLVFSALPSHAAQVSGYERAQRERMRVLGDGQADRAWLDALEAQAARSGAKVAAARADTVRALVSEIESRDGGHFPAAHVDLTGEWDRLALQDCALD